MITSLRYFHFFIFNLSVKFQGKVNEIVGFSCLTDDDRDLLREFPSADVHEPTAEDEDDDEDDEYSDGDLYGSDIEVEPPSKRSTAAIQDLQMITIAAKEKTKER